MTTATTQPPTSPPVRRVAFGKAEPQGHRTLLYGPGGIGKTTLAAIAPGPVAFIDLDESMPVLSSQLPDETNVRIVSGVASWQDLREALHASGWDEIQTVVIDSATKAEELAAQWVIANVRHEQGRKIERIEDYGWGKGYTHVYEIFLRLLGDLDAHARAGRHVVLICHDCTSAVPNPQGEDWLRYEPRLQSPSSGKNSTRLRAREWADHVLFLGYDISVEGGKASSRSCQTRTIYPVEQPHCMAKSRTLSEQIPLTKHDASLWSRLIVA